MTEMLIFEILRFPSNVLLRACPKNDSYLPQIKVTAIDK